MRRHMVVRSPLLFAVSAPISDRCAAARMTCARNSASSSRASRMETRALIKSLAVLTEKEKKVIVFYYYEELTLKEISNILEVSESRISQLHTRALQKMKSNLGEYSDILNII